MIRNLASGTRSQVLKACIMPPLKSFPGVEVIYVKGSSSAFDDDGSGFYSQTGIYKELLPYRCSLRRKNGQEWRVYLDISLPCQGQL